MPGTMSSKPLILSISLAVIITSLLLIPNIYASFEDGRQKLTSVERSDLLDQPLESGRVSGSWSEIGAGSATGGGISKTGGESRYPAISAANDGNIYIAWDDLSTGDREIYVRRWNGAGWQEVGSGSASGGGISSNGGESQIPKSVVSPNGDYYVVWCDDSSGDFEIYVKRWNGSNWQEAGSGSASGGGISNNSGDSLSPKIAVAPDGTPYVCWIDVTSGDWEIYVRRFLAGEWQEVGKGSAGGGGVSDNEGLSRSCTITLDSKGTPYVGWRDNSAGNLEAYARRWNGSEWEEIGTDSAQGGGVSNTPAYSGNPKIRVDNNDMASMTWNDQTVKPNEIFYRKWNGSNWKEIGSSGSGGGISKNSGNSKAPFLEYKGGTPYIAWHDNSSGDYEIYVRRWTGDSWAELSSGSATSGGISHNSGDSFKPGTIFGPDGTYYVVWHDDSSGDSEIYVKQWIESETQIPLPPSEVAASDGTYDDKVQITWNASLNTTFYQLFRAENATEDKTKIGDTDSTTYIDNSTVAGTTYFYWVKACNADDCSIFSSWDTGWRSEQTPSIPDNLQASDGVYSDRIRVIWNSTTSTDNYEVYRATSSEGTRVLMDTVSTPAYDDLSVAAGITYFYWVKACNSIACSDFSEYDDGRLKETYNLTLITSGLGDVQVSPDKPSFEFGETITLTAVADTGWLFTSWSGDLSGETNPTTLLMDNDKFVTALFDKEDNGGEEAFTAFLPVNMSGYTNSAAWDFAE